MARNGRDSRRRDWLLIGALAVAALVLGVIGFGEYYMALNDPQSLSNRLYLSIMLFTLNSGGVPGVVPLSLEVARFLAPLVAAGAMVKAALTVFGEYVEQRRAGRLQDHVIVCGLGQKGLHYLRDLGGNDGKRRRGLVVVEKDPENGLVPAARALGAKVVFGDAATDQVLRNAGVLAARDLIAVTGDDVVNTKTGITAQRLVGEGRRRSAALRCHVHVTSPDLFNLLRGSDGFWERTDRFEPHVFSVYRDAARELLRRSPLDWREIPADSTLRVRLVIIGFGRMGQHVALHAAQIGHFANGSSPEIIVVDPMAAARLRGFFFRYPRFKEVVAGFSAVDADIRDGATADRLRLSLGEEGVVPTVAICLEDEAVNVSVALGLAEWFRGTDCNFLLRMPQQDMFLDGLKRALRVGTPGRIRVEGYGAFAECCNCGVLFDSDVDRLARQWHENHRNLSGALADGASKQPWESLAEEYRDSNRRVADHLPVKLRAVGCVRLEDDADGGSGDPVVEFREDEVEQMARMEHRSWCAEKRLAGYRYADVPVKNSVKRLHPGLLPWDEITEKDKNFSREQVRLIPRLIRVGRCPTASPPT